jgi:spore protease
MVISLREIDLKNFHIHTDLIDEVESCLNETTRIVDDIVVKKYHLDAILASSLNKKEGEYVTIEFDDITDTTNYKKLKTVLKEELKPFLKGKDKILFIGLGNKASTPDSLGPLVIEDVLVTAYLKEFGPLEKGFRETMSFSPGVTGSNGIETSTVVLNLVKSVNPSFVVLIDALASKSLRRVCKTIQITTAGITPGGGIGNSREEISFDTLGVPVLALGVPTVVDAVSVVSDTITFLEKKYSFQKEFMNQKRSRFISSSKVNYLKEDIKMDVDKEKLLGLVGTLNDDELKQLFYEVLTPIGYNLMVTPKEIDFVIKRLATLISSAFNETIHSALE